MANTHSTLKELLTNIASAIKAKNNSTAPIVADDFPSEIEKMISRFDYISQRVTSIPDYAFYNTTELLNANLCGVTDIGTAAFKNCSNLKTVILYDTTVSVGEDTFKGCDNAVIYCEAPSKPDTWNENWNPDNCTVMWGHKAIETWDISATEEDNVTAKLYNDIHHEGMYQLVISGSGAMFNYYTHDRPPWYAYRDEITSVAINYSVTSICSDAFFGCTSLTSITIPDSVTYIGKNTFYSCSRLTSITIPDSVRYIYIYTFYNCRSLTSVTISDSVTSISGSAFRGCTNLTSITIPDSVTSIGESAFAYCTSLTSVTISDSVTSISGSAFRGCTNLTSITIPDSVTSIGDHVFRDCLSLTSITIWDSVAYIGADAFYSCRSLTSIIYKGTMEQWNNIEFDIHWNLDTGNYTIHCTDGDIPKS